MRASVASLLILAALLVSTGVEARVPIFAMQRSLLTLPPLSEIKAWCRAKTVVHGSLYGDGKVVAKGKSTCSAFAASIDSLQVIVKEYIGFVEDTPGPSCTVAKLKEVATSCAVAIAKVFVTAKADIYVEGYGAACVNAKAEGDAYARAYAAALVKLWVAVTDGHDAAEAEAMVKALTFALSRAWAAAAVSVCQYGSGTASASESAFAKQVDVAITCVFAEAAAKLCRVAYSAEVPGGKPVPGVPGHPPKYPDPKCPNCGPGELNSYLTKTESSAAIGVCSKSYKAVDESSSSGGTEQGEVEVCTGAYKKCCDKYYLHKTLCVCGPKCLLTHNKKTEGSGVWRLGDDNLCVCPNLKELEAKVHAEMHG